jgi:hypothetical protein
VNNDNYDYLVNQVSDARDTVNARSQALQQVKAEANRLAQQAGQSGLSLGGALGVALAGGLSVGVAEASYNEAVNELNNLRSQLSRTPRTLQEPVYADEAYDFITHNMTYGAEFTLTPLGPDGRALRTVPLAATRTHRTVEVNGNRSRGVPVQVPQDPSAAEIDQALASDLAAQAAKVDGVLSTLAAASFEVQARRKFAEADPLASLDRSWALSLLWRGAGVTASAVAPLERELRNRLGLGSAAAN